MLLCQNFHSVHPLRYAFQIQFIEKVDDMLIGSKTLITEVVLLRSLFQQFILIIEEYRCLLVQAGDVMQYIQAHRVVRRSDINAQ